MVLYLSQTCENSCFHYHFDCIIYRLLLFPAPHVDWLARSSTRCEQDCEMTKFRTATSAPFLFFLFDLCITVSPQDGEKSWIYFVDTCLVHTLSQRLL